MKAVKNNFIFAVKPFVYLITDGTATEENYPQKETEILELVRAASESEISFVQIREKNLSARKVFQLASKAVSVAVNSNTKIFVNDRADIALAAKADGVHLTAKSLSAAAIRAHFPAELIVGVSAHSIAEAEKAKSEGADFATFSPVYASPGKGAPQGIEALREVCKRLKPFPVIALGGIDRTNYESVLACGASGFAAIRFLNDVERLRELKKKFPAKVQSGQGKN